MRIIDDCLERISFYYLDREFRRDGLEAANKKFKRKRAKRNENINRTFEESIIKDIKLRLEIMEREINYYPEYIDRNYDEICYELDKINSQLLIFNNYNAPAELKQEAYNIKDVIDRIYDKAIQIGEASRKEIIDKVKQIYVLESSNIEEKKVFEWIYERLTLSEIDEAHEIHTYSTFRVSSSNILFGKLTNGVITNGQITAFQSCIRAAMFNDIEEAIISFQHFICDYNYNLNEPFSAFEKLSMKIMVESILRNLGISKSKEVEENRIKKINNTIMKVLSSNDVEKIKQEIEIRGFSENMLFSVNTLEGEKFDVTLGYNTFGEDVCTGTFDTYIEAYKFAAIRAILGYDIKSY